MRVVPLVVLVIAAIVTPLAWGQQVPADTRGHWAEDRIQVLLQRNIIDLFPDQTFRPSDEITRGEFIKWLITAVGLPPRAVRTSSFADVSPSHPMSPYIESALAFGLITRVPVFLPSTAITRGEAIALAVDALGYSFETAPMARRPLPFEDVDALPESVRGAVAVAMVAEPPLLAEPPSLYLRPQAEMTRGEAASLVWAILGAIEQGIVLRNISAVTSGVDLITEKRGVLRALPVWRVQIGAFVSEENAQRLAASMRERGLPTLVDFLDGFYKVRVGSFATSVEAALLKDQLASEGFPTWVIQTLQDFDNFPGPFRTAALVVDTTASVKLVPTFGDGQRLSRQRTSDLARRAGALAAVNGGFFSSSGALLGCLMVSGEIITAPDPQRTCAGMTDDGAVVFDRVLLAATVSAENSTVSLDGVNRDRRADELILYRPAFDLTTHTNPFGAEAVVEAGIVTSVVDLRGDSAIPRDGFVLSGHGRARQWILQTIQPGTAVSVEIRFTPSSADARWERVMHAVGGGPRLLASGRFVGGEGFPPSFADRRHPRTAIGVLADGRVVLLVVDGRQPYHSLGMTLVELAMELRRLGAVEAMNLDGGGSTTMVVAGRVVNLPSDETGERPVGNALLVLSQPNGP